MPILHKLRRSQPRARRTPAIAELKQATVDDCLKTLSCNVSGIVERGDMECVHKARVALRRLRSVDVAFPDIDNDHNWKRRMKDAHWLARLLGEVRDWQILQSQILPPIADANQSWLDLSSLQKQIGKSQQAALKPLIRALQSKRFERFAQIGVDKKNVDAAPLMPSTRQFSRSALDQQLQCVRAYAEKWNELDATQRHELRKQVKKLRYSMDFYAAVFAKTKVTNYLTSLAHIQKYLGALNDSASAQTRLLKLLRYKSCQAAASAAIAWLIRADFDKTNQAGTAIALWLQSKPFWH